MAKLEDIPTIDIEGPPKPKRTGCGRRFWVRWFNRREYGAFTLFTPWWVSGHRCLGEEAEEAVLVAAIKADGLDEARDIIGRCYDVPCEPEISFIEERDGDWEPFCDRFPRAAWMEKYWNRSHYRQSDLPDWGEP